MKPYTQTLKTIFLALILSFGISFVYAWAGPTGTPQNSNAPAPINTSIDQYKNGALGVGGILEGYGGIIGLSNAGNNTLSQWLGQLGGGGSGNGANSGFVGMEFETIANGASAGQPEQKLNFWTHRGGVANGRALTIDGIGNVGINNVGTGLTFPDGTKQTTASLGASAGSYVTGTYVGNGVDNREIAVGFQPDDVEVGTVAPVAYTTVHRNKNVQSGYSQYTTSGDWTTTGIKNSTTNGFTLGTSINVNEMSRSYWYNAFKGGTPPALAVPVINSFAISPSLIGLGQSTTATWTSSGTSYCVASGSNWSGNKASSGSASITPTAIGILTYTITCYNDAGQSVANSTAVDVRNWKTTTSNGNFGESCDSWLSRTGQAGVNGSAPNAYLYVGGGGTGQCVYIAGGTVSGDYTAAASSYADGTGYWQPASWHCCGDNGQEANTSTRR